jgi:hypothetical protein
MYGWETYDMRSDFNGPYPWEQPLKTAWMSSDTYHPNAVGNAVIAKGYESIANDFAPNCHGAQT